MLEERIIQGFTPLGFPLLRAVLFPYTQGSVERSTKMKLEILLKSTTGSVLIQARDPENTTIERRR